MCERSKAGGLTEVPDPEPHGGRRLVLRRDGLVLLEERQQLEDAVEQAGGGARLEPHGLGAGVSPEPETLLGAAELAPLLREKAARSPAGGSAT